VVTVVLTPEAVRGLLAGLTDPEIPVLTLDDLGIVRGVTVDDGRVVVTITPTYSGCPALEAMSDDIVGVLAQAGLHDVTVRTVLSPAWTTDWMSAAGRRKLEEYGIAPPAPRASGPVLVPLGRHVPSCPQCGSGDTEELTRFASTACKALWRCRSCREPFDHFKAH